MLAGDGELELVEMMWGQGVLKPSSGMWKENEEKQRPKLTSKEILSCKVSKGINPHKTEKIIKKNEKQPYVVIDDILITFICKSKSSVIPCFPMGACSVGVVGFARQQPPARGCSWRRGFTNIPYLEPLAL